MSAFIVSNKTMNQAIEAMRLCGFNHDGVYLDDPDHIKVLGAELFKLNASAVAQRYNEPEEETEFKFEWQDCNKFQALKSLQCLIYQCSEGNVPETKLYKILRECESAMKNLIIDDLPEYEAAKWDAE
jgi:hypothetical protein